MTAGHSYGEYVALAAAGVISDSALFDLSESRGRAIKDTTHDEAGTMAAVQADADAITKALDGMEGITLANHNSPRQTVISGANAAVRAAIQKLEAAGLAARLIPVACAFHSPLMEPAREPVRRGAGAADISPSPPQRFSPIRWAASIRKIREEIAALLASHLVRPVKFVDEIRAMYDQGARVFVEVGPKGVLTGLARQILDGKDARFIQIDSDRNGLVQFLNALAQLAAEGVAVDDRAALRGRIAPGRTGSARNRLDGEWPASLPAQPAAAGGEAARSGHAVRRCRAPPPAPAPIPSRPRRPVPVRRSPAPSTAMP